jgi:outer membrane PBP1 activator LpoA protein
MKLYAKLILRNQDIIKFSLLSLLLLISGCAFQTGGQDPFAGNESVEERKAGQLFAEGKYSDAARLYQRLAQQPSARQDILRLKAAQAFLKIPQDSQAKNNLDLVAADKLTGQQRNHLNLMYAQLDLNAGNTDQALQYLMHISVPSLNRAEKTTYYEMTAFAYALAGEIVKSTHARVSLDLYLPSEQQKESNNSAILELLSLMHAQTLQEQRQQPQTSIVYSGWLALEQTRRDFPSGAQQQQAFNEWEDLYPRHPAQALVSSGYFLVSGFKLANVRTIAVFLPESGPYLPYAAALKAGFVAAYNRQEYAGMRPDVRFYDTRQANISTIYRKAVADGAQLVIGPLNKKQIKELAERNDLTVPVMALNYVEGLAKSNLYQFALSPIDEVQQAVQQASLTGYSNAIILAPDTVDGQRMSQYFQHAWEALNGNVLQVQSFDPRAKDFSFPVREMLSINESQFRFAQLQKVIGTVEYQPRRRQDVDVIFLAASAKNARLINPQFYHNHAGSVAVYGLAKVYQGYADKNKDIDLENISFCTIPWLFDAAYQGDLSRLSLQDVHTQFPQRYLSLIAFGIDAYTVVAHLNDLATEPHYGATGDLLLNESHRIERHLVCAKFKNGEALLIEMAEEPDEEIPVRHAPSVNTLKDAG